MQKHANTLTEQKNEDHYIPSSQWEPEKWTAVSVNRGLLKSSGSVFSQCFRITIEELFSTKPLTKLIPNLFHLQLHFFKAT